MKKHTIYLLVIITFLMVSCNSKKVSEQQEFLSGYWVIESVTMPDGSTKKFGPTTSIDFVEITGDSGIRKKLMPKLDGTYRKFVGSEQFFLETKDRFMGGPIVRLVYLFGMTVEGEDEVQECVA